MDWRVEELKILAGRLDSAFKDGSDYALSKAAQNMRLFSEEVDPSRKKMFDAAERLQKVTADLVSAMDSIDTSAIEDFVRLGREG